MPRVKKTSEPGTPTQEVRASASSRREKGNFDKEFVIQYGGSEWNTEDIAEKAVAAYVAEGHQRGRIKKLTVYVKPEEQKIYYVINDKATGSTALE